MTPTPSPDDVRPQHEEALARAVYVRVRAGELKQAIRAGELPLTRAITLDDLPDDDRDVLARRPVGEILLCGRRLGRSGVNKILAVAAISSDKRLGTLTPRQRDVLVDLIGRRAPWLTVADTEAAA